MADKRLSITADLKVKTTDAEKTLKKLEKEGVKISKILKDLDINTAQGRGGFAKSLTMASKEMLKLKGTTTDTGRVLEHVYGRQLEKQGRNLDLYTRKVERLNKIYKTYSYNNEFQSAMGNRSEAARARAGMDRVGERIVVAEAARQGIKLALEELRGVKSGPTSLMGAIASDGFRNAMGGMSAGLNGAAALFQAGQTLKTMEVANIARTRDFERGVLSRMMSGDFSDAYYGSQRMHNGQMVAKHVGDDYGDNSFAKGTQALKAMGAGADAALGLSQMFGGMKGVAGGGIVGGTGRVSDISNVGQGSGNFSSAMGNLALQMGGGLTGGPQATAAQTAGIGFNALKQTDPVGNAALQQLQATAAMRTAAAKNLQGQHMAMWGIGRVRSWDG
jgi:hypothetical protein